MKQKVIFIDVFFHFNVQERGKILCLMLKSRIFAPNFIRKHTFIIKR
jgi:hypothetical protein